jgi:predicted DNA-binding transcriptional regulator YafY
MNFSERDIQPDCGQDDAELSMPMINFKFKLGPAVAYRIFDDFGGGELQADGSYIANVRWIEDDWVYGLILSYGEHIEVIEPVYAREVIRKKIEKINKKHL